MVFIPWAVRNSANRLLQIKITKGFQLVKTLFLQNTIEQLALKWGIMLWSGPAEVFSAFWRERDPWGAKQCSPRKENISELEEVQSGQPMRQRQAQRTQTAETEKGITEGPEVCTWFQKSRRNTRSSSVNKKLYACLRIRSWQGSVGTETLQNKYLPQNGGKKRKMMLNI